jgi:hypothetical protein
MMNAGQCEDVESNDNDVDDDVNNDDRGSDDARGRRGQRVWQHPGSHNNDDEIEYGYLRSRRRTLYKNKGLSSLTPTQIMEQETYYRYAKVAVERVVFILHLVLLNQATYVNLCLLVGQWSGGAIGYSWLDELLRNPCSGVQTPQVLGYSGMRVAEPLVGGSNPYGAGVSLRGWGLGPHMSNQDTLDVDFREIQIKNPPTLMGEDTRDWTTLIQLVSHQ